MQLNMAAIFLQAGALDQTSRRKQADHMHSPFSTASWLRGQSDQSPQSRDFPHSPAPAMVDYTFKLWFNVNKPCLPEVDCVTAGAG